jgi:hypothetical protein
MSDWTLEQAIEIARARGRDGGYRSYDGSGGLWAGDAKAGVADAQFEDPALARATAEILNAVLDGRLVPNEAEYAAALELRYAAAFPKDPLPMVHWHRGYGPELFRLMEAAIERDRPLTANDLLAAQGMAPAPPDSVV